MPKIVFSRNELNLSTEEENFMMDNYDGHPFSIHRFPEEMEKSIRDKAKDFGVQGDFKIDPADF